LDLSEYLPKRLKRTDAKQRGYLFKNPTIEPQDKELLKEQYREMRIRNRTHPPEKLLTKEPKNKKFSQNLNPKNQTE
jgi:hypothetical protein